MERERVFFIFSEFVRSINLWFISILHVFWMSIISIFHICFAHAPSHRIREISAIVKHITPFVFSPFFIPLTTASWYTHTINIVNERNRRKLLKIYGCHRMEIVEIFGSKKYYLLSLNLMWNCRIQKLRMKNVWIMAVLSLNRYHIK